MVDAHVYRGHFPCGLFGCLAIPLDQQGDAHVFTLGLCDNGEPCFAKVQSFNVNLKSASNLNGNLNCSKELEHYSS